MKDLPATVEGPLGPWYQRVNKMIAEANLAMTAEVVKSILGEPDTIEIVPDEERISDETGKVDSAYPDSYYEYADPYRPGFFYRYGFVANSVTERSRQVRKQVNVGEQGAGANRRG